MWHAQVGALSVGKLAHRANNHDRCSSRGSGQCSSIACRSLCRQTTGMCIARLSNRLTPALWCAVLAVQDMEEEQVMVARMLHQLMCDDLRLQFAILRAARTHLELGGPARMRHTLPALAFCALKALRRLLPGQSDAAAAGAAAAAVDASKAAEEAVTAESALQWLLEVALQLAEVPAPMPALRLLLVCAHISSEEAGLEMLAYEFFEQVGQMRCSAAKQPVGVRLVQQLSTPV